MNITSAASATHPGEEPMVVRAFIQARRTAPELKLVIAPRDPGRCTALFRELPIAGFRVACYLDPLESKQGADIMFLNTIGILANAYALCTVAFVGGSLVAQGGHNLLEPAMFGKPVLFGPHMTDFREMAQLFIQGKAAFWLMTKKPWPVNWNNCCAILTIAAAPATMPGKSLTATQGR